MMLLQIALAFPHRLGTITSHQAKELNGGLVLLAQAFEELPTGIRG